MVAMTFFFVVFPMLKVQPGNGGIHQLLCYCAIAFVGVAAPFRDGGLTKETLHESS